MRGAVACRYRQSYAAGMGQGVDVSGRFERDQRRRRFVYVHACMCVLRDPCTESLTAVFSPASRHANGQVLVRRVPILAVVVPTLPKNATVELEVSSAVARLVVGAVYHKHSIPRSQTIGRSSLSTHPLFHMFLACLRRRLSALI